MIVHLDMDAFYAAVEIRDNPQLANRPVVVGGSPQGRGVISAASYAARKFGVHSAMSSAQALRLCPQLHFVKPRMEHYASISRQIRTIFESYTSLVEPLSLDEAFLDVSGSEALFGDAVSIARQIKQRVVQETQLTVSAGVAPNKFLAKLASDLQKPDGLVVVPADRIEAFLDPLPISRMWGVGQQTQTKLERLGVYTVQQLRALSLPALEASFGLNGAHFWRLARGLDTRPVVPDRETKSISHETTFYIDITEPEVLRAWARELADQVSRRMRHYAILGKTVQLKLRYSNFETLTRSLSLGEPTNSSTVLGDTALRLLSENPFQLQRGVRLLGVGMSRLSRPIERQMSLFDNEDRSRSARLDTARDQIQNRFGEAALTRATSLEHQIALRSMRRPE